MTEPQPIYITDLSMEKPCLNWVGWDSTAVPMPVWGKLHPPQSLADLLERIEQLETRVAVLEAKGI